MKTSAMMNFYWVFLFLALLLAWQNSHANPQVGLSLSEYLKQVREKHEGVQASSLISSGTEKRAEEGTLLLAPTLFGVAQFASDGKPTNNPAFLGTKTKVNNYQLGVRKLTTFGLDAKLYYNLNYYAIEGVNSAFVPVSKFHEAKPVLELSQSLWRNGFGADTRANQNLLEAQRLAVSYGESFKKKSALSEAESSYWRLALAQEQVRVQRESYQRAQKIKDWSSRRTQLQLADRADLLQAEAALQTRLLELQTAIDEERSAAKNFNTARGLSSEDVLESLELPASEALVAIDSPKRETMRDDVKAAAQNQRVAVAVAEMGLQHLSPELELFGSLGYNGRNPELSETVSDSFKATYPTWNVGMRFSAPIDLPTIFRSREGYHLEKEGAELAFHRKVFEQERDWSELSKKLSESKKRLQLAQSIEKAQKEKLDYEKMRHARGRTTTFQVLLFEQDFATAQLGRIRIQSELLNLVAQMKIFGETL